MSQIRLLTRRVIAVLKNLRSDVVYWPETEVPRRPRFGGDQVESGHEADIARRPSLTLSVVSPPSIVALR